jgi:hypothetical protein
VLIELLLRVSALFFFVEGGLHLLEALLGGLVGLPIVFVLSFELLDHGFLVLAVDASLDASSAL